MHAWKTFYNLPTPAFGRWQKCNCSNNGLKAPPSNKEVKDEKVFNRWQWQQLLPDTFQKLISYRPSWTKHNPGNLVNIHAWL